MDIKAKLGRERSQLKAYARNIQQRATPNLRHISGRIDLLCIEGEYLIENVVSLRNIRGIKEL